MESPDHAHRQRDIDDLGSVLRALLKKEECDPAELVHEHLTDDLTAFRDNFESFTVEVPNMTPRLRIECGAQVMTGGSGIVFRVTHAEIPSLHYALKIPRPSLLSVHQRISEIDEAAARVSAEYLMHAPLSHQNVARVFTAGSLNIRYGTSTDISLRVVLMEWVDGATPLIDYLVSKAPDHVRTISLLSDCFWGLDHLHANKLIHWDMKSDNFLINSDGVPKLMDIGNARRTDDDARKKYAYSSKQNLPETLWPNTPNGGQTNYSSRLCRVALPNLDWDAPWVDLWMLARELNRLFGALEEKFDDVDAQRGVRLKILGTLCSVPEIQKHRHAYLETVFPRDNADAQFALRFVTLILCRILNQESLIEDGYYTQARQVALDLQKFEPEFGSAQSIPELQAVPQRVLRLPQSGNAPYPSRIGRLYNSKVMTRLRKHLQLGTVFHVYPGANHRRSEHAAGVLDTVTQFIRALYADQSNPFWRLAIESKDINALLVAGILHDSGHIAYGHFLEEMEGLFAGRAHEDYLAMLLDPNPANKAIRGIRFGVVAQESANADRQIVQLLIARDWIDREHDVEKFLQDVANVLHPLTISTFSHMKASQFIRETSDVIKDEILHSILDSAIDADKLDYLLRDAHHCGVKYPEGIDADRFFQSLTTISDLSALEMPGTDDLGGDPKSPQACVGVTRKGLLPVENILIARYQMFSSVYWHHTTRAETAMLQLAVVEFVGSEQAQTEERLEDLIESFRNRSDEESLKWLREKIESHTIMSRKLKPILMSACDAVLGDRSKLYRTIFELHYEPQTTTSEGITDHGTTKAVYRALLKITKEREEADNAEDYLVQVRAIRQDFCKRMSDKLGRSVAFLDGEVLIDIPPASKDQVENVFVHTDDGPKPIQELSPIAEAVRDTFAYWARPVRVFISPDALERAEKRGYSRKALDAICWKILQEIEREQDKQLDLSYPN